MSKTQEITALVLRAIALAMAVAICDTHYVTLAAGALLFLTSDFMWGKWMIRGHVWKCVNDGIWATYVCGQLLIVYSVATALNATLSGV